MLGRPNFGLPRLLVPDLCHQLHQLCLWRTNLSYGEISDFHSWQMCVYLQEECGMMYLNEANLKPHTKSAHKKIKSFCVDTRLYVVLFQIFIYLLRVNYSLWHPKYWPILWLIIFSCRTVCMFKFFLATLVALHFTPMSESVSESVGIVSDKRSLELVLSWSFSKGGAMLRIRELLLRCAKDQTSWMLTLLLWSMIAKSTEVSHPKTQGTNTLVCIWSCKQMQPYVGFLTASMRIAVLEGFQL